MQKPSALTPRWVIAGMAPLRLANGELPADLIGEGLMIQGADDFLNSLPLGRVMAERRGTGEVPNMLARSTDPAVPRFDAAFAAFDAASLLTWSDPTEAEAVLRSIALDQTRRFGSEIRLQAYLRSAVVQFAVRSTSDGDTTHGTGVGELIAGLKNLGLGQVDTARGVLFNCWLWCMSAQTERLISDLLDRTEDEILRSRLVEQISNGNHSEPDFSGQPLHVLAVRAQLEALASDRELPAFVRARARLLLADSLLQERHQDRFAAAGISPRSRGLQLLAENLDRESDAPNDVHARTLILWAAALASRPESESAGLELVLKALANRRELFADYLLRELLLLGLWIAERVEPERCPALRAELDAIRPPQLPPFPPGRPPVG
jgi:hypothetical protein